MVKYQIRNNTWSEFVPSSGRSSIPAAFAMSVLHRNPRLRKVLVWSERLFGETHGIFMFNLDTGAWSLPYPLSIPNTPIVGVADPTMQPHWPNYCAAVVYQNRMFLLGGYNTSGLTQDSLFTYDICARTDVDAEIGECQMCPEGTISLDGRCNPCQLGFTSQRGAENCSACAAGLFGALDADTGLPKCVACPAGTFSNATSQTSCSLCAAGTTSAPGSTVCSRCEGGRYSNAYTAGLCISCPLGQIPNGGATGCELCGVGNSTRAPLQAECTACDESNLYSNLSTGSVCEVCPRGSVVAAQDRGSCVLCPAGTYHPGPRVALCVMCPEGRTSTIGAASCEACPAGSYSNSATRGLCQSCGAGQVPSESRADCVYAASSNSVPQGGINLDSAASQSNQAAVVAAIVVGVLLGVALVLIGLLLILVLKNKKQKFGL